MLEFFRVTVMLVCVTVAALISAAVSEDGAKYNDLDTWEAPSEIRDNFVYYLSGFDDDDRPIWIAETGKWDARRIFDEGGEKLEWLNKHIHQALYRFNKSLTIRMISLKTFDERFLSSPNDPVPDGVVLLDMEGYDATQLAHAKTIVWALNKAQDVAIVSKRMAKGFIVNVNFIAQRLLSFLSPILGSAGAKTQVYGTNKDVWIPKLLKELPKESLPPFYGGSQDFPGTIVWIRGSVSAILITTTVAEDNSENDFDTWEAPLEIRKNFVYYLSGFDDENRPIWIGEVGKWPVRDIFDAQDPEKEKALYKYIDQALYRYNQSLSLRSTPENPVNEGSVILDLDGFELRTLSHSKSIKFGLDKAHDVVIVANRMAYGFMINMNYFAYKLIDILKPILGPGLERTELFGTNNVTWIPSLLDKFPKKSLPKFYGGDEDFKPVVVYG
ncbi:unnamed protein product [Allacma fusca]|uniref:CRAL-TRIO domain-containing protein n=1 Tax=Allacma fusca TaxID=39272 RepID=A0A8J2J8Y6_9HEXA|nr:unnamed protein product [Allacma fusca]